MPKKIVGEESGGLYEGTVRVVTEADILNDSRLVAASAVVGQLYDFSNLPSVKDGAIEHDVEAVNKRHDQADEQRVRQIDRVPEVAPFTSEAERAKLGIATPEEVKAQEKLDEEARKRVEERVEESKA